MKSGITFKNVSFSYEEGKEQLNNVSFNIKRGSFCGITGTNGSGKTTLTLFMNGLIPHEVGGKYKGDVTLDNVSTKELPVSYLASRVGMVFQNPDFMLFNLTIKEEIEFGLKNFQLKDHDKRIDEALKTVGMEGYKAKDPQTLSYGQKQKICLASVLAADPQYIVLDEPTAMLDYKSSLSLYELLSKLAKNGKTIIIIEHDTDLLAQYADQIIVIDHGKIIADGTPKKVFAQNSQLKEIGIKIPRIFS